MARTPLGRAVLADAKGRDLEPFNYQDNPRLADLVLGTVMTWSEKKKQHAQEMHRELKKSVRLKA